jgi:hypothetical protein
VWLFLVKLTQLVFAGFKEVAFAQALVAASVAKAVSLDCARGVMSSCDKIGSKKRRSKKEYVNYNEAIAHGIYFSEKFLNSGQSSHDFQGMVSRHNFRVGRLVGNHISFSTFFKFNIVRLLDYSRLLFFIDFAI